MLRFSFVFLLLAVTPALAEPTITETQPVAGDPFRDFRIEGCSGTKSMASFRYSRKNGGDVLEMSDICLDEENGQLVSIENATNLTLVEKTEDARAFEIISSGNDRYSRVRFDFSSEVNSPDCMPSDIGSNAVMYNSPYGSRVSAHGDAYAFNAMGHSIGPISSSPASSSATGVYLALRPLSQNGKAIEVSFDADAFGDFNMTGQTGTVIIRKGDNNFVGEAYGELRLSVDEEGNVLGEGEFSFKNRRLAGHAPREWVSMTGNIPYIRGNFLGKNGEFLNAFGLARGTYVDASGEEHSFRSQVFLFKCFSDAE